MTESPITPLPEDPMSEPNLPKFAPIFAALAAPFHESELKTRTQGGRQLTYVTARTVMNRLDDVLGPSEWWDEYIPGENSVLCKLTIRLPDGSTLTKQDAGGYAGMADSGDDDKSGYSDSYKRAAVKFGVARYLYRDGVPTFVTALTRLEDAPAPAAPARGPAPEPAPARAARNGHGNDQGCPRNGRQMFAWVKEMEQKHAVGLIKYLTGWAKLQEFPARMVDWDPNQIALAHAEAVRKLGTGTATRAEMYEEALSN